MDCCEDFKNVLIDHPFLFQKYSNYGTIIAWIEISDEGTFHKTHTYGIPILFCPFCGKNLKEPEIFLDNSDNI